jgi:hypothetical protein
MISCTNQLLEIICTETVLATAKILAERAALGYFFKFSADVHHASLYIISYDELAY